MTPFGPRDGGARPSDTTQDPSTETETETAARGLARRIVALGLVVGGIGSLFAAWIGGLLVFRVLGIAIEGDEWLAWVLAGFVAVVLWPIVRHRAHVDSWRRGHGGARPPRRRITGPDLAVRSLVLLVGAAGLLALCGPRGVVGWLSTLWSVAAPGPSSSGALLQLLALLAAVALMAPAMLLTQRRRRRVARDDPAYVVLEVRQNWYTSAALGWVICLAIGLTICTAALIAL